MQGVTIHVLKEGRHHRQQHARGGHHVASARVLGTAQALQGEEERGGRNEIEEVNQRFATHSATSSDFSLRTVGLALNISSMRSVTTKPPTTLRVPRMTARKPSTISRLVLAAPRMSIEPTRMTP